MKEYYIFKLKMTEEATESELNRLASIGWELVCSYRWHNNYLIMSREKKKRW